jgi:hypothetical protein
MASREHLARALWTVFEPIHAVTYFSDEARQAFADVGLPRYWDSYFAGRSAPLGAVTAAPVTAMFSGFAPALVSRALPAAWAIASVEQVLEARALGAANTLRRLFPDEAAAAQAADVLVPIAAAADPIGRPLSAANQALPVSDDPYRRLWQATATLREHRGDGHVLALVDGGIAGILTIILRGGLDLDAGTMQKSRGWNDDEWAAGREVLTERGLLDSHGRVTRAGRKALDRAEETTNRLATQPWDGLSDDDLRQVATTVLPVTRSCTALFPYPNPIGMPQPWDPDSDPEALSVAATPE